MGRWAVAHEAPDRWVVSLDDEAVLLDRGVGEEEPARRGVLGAHAADPLRGENGLPLVGPALLEREAERGHELGVVSGAGLVVGEAGVGGEGGPADGLAQPLPLLLRRAGQRDEAVGGAVEALERAESAKEPVGLAARRLPLVADEVVGGDVGVAGEHRRLQVLALAGALLGAESESHRGAHGHRRRYVGATLVRPVEFEALGVDLVDGHGLVDGRRLVAPPELPQSAPGQGAGGGVKRGAARSRSAGAVGPRVVIDDLGIDLADRLVVHAEPLRGVAAHVVHDGVGLLHQPVRDLPPLLAAQVDGQAFFAVEGLAAALRPRAELVACERFDLDHARAEVGEERRA